MAAVGEMVTGKGARKQARLAEEAQARQAALIAEEKARLKAVEDGQQANAQTGGIGGLLAYADRGAASGGSGFGGTFTGTNVDPGTALRKKLGGVFA